MTKCVMKLYKPKTYREYYFQSTINNLICQCVVKPGSVIGVEEYVLNNKVILKHNKITRKIQYDYETFIPIFERIRKSGIGRCARRYIEDALKLNCMTTISSFTSWL